MILCMAMLISTNSAQSHLYFGEHVAADSLYNVDYLNWQKPMNIFGARVKGDLIGTFLAKETKHVLEFGCSAGYILAGLGGNTLRKTCVEINEAAREYASQEHDRKLAVFETTRSAKRNGILSDFIYSTSALEHCECPLCELRDLKTVLQPQGVLLIGVRNDGIDLQQNFHKFNIDPNHHLYTWNELLLSNIISAAGFHVCKSRGQYEAWVPPFELASYEADRESFCRRGLTQGLRTSTFYLWSVSVLPGNEDACGELSIRLDRTQNCSYLLHV